MIDTGHLILILGNGAGSGRRVGTHARDHQRLSHNHTINSFLDIEDRVFPRHNGARYRAFHVNKKTFIRTSWIENFTLDVRHAAHAFYPFIQPEGISFENLILLTGTRRFLVPGSEPGSEGEGRAYESMFLISCLSEIIVWCDVVGMGMGMGIGIGIGICR